jgi:hypothetical protein
MCYMYLTEHIWYNGKYVIFFKYTINLFLITDFYHKGDVTARKEALVITVTCKLNFVVWLLQDLQGLNTSENTYNNTNTWKCLK